MAYRVKAPFVYLKVKDPVTGTFSVQGLYEGAVVDDVEEENLKHHLDLNMVEEVGGRAPKRTEEPASSDEDTPAQRRRS
jgi:hypothetical protein